MASTTIRRCRVNGCSKRAQTQRLCKAHGGGVRCRVPGCNKLVQTRGLCVAHGGGCRCLFEGCSKLGQYTGFCLSHGGGRRCRVPNCQKFVQIRGYCKRHGRQFLSDGVEKKLEASEQSISDMSKFSLNFLLNPLIADMTDAASIESTPKFMTSTLSTKPISQIPTFIAINEFSSRFPVKTINSTIIHNITAD